MFFFDFVFSLGFFRFCFLTCVYIALLTADYAENCNKEISIKAIFTSFIAFVFDK